MSEKRVKFHQILQNQLPSYVSEEFPLVSEFLSQYYVSQEYQGAPIDLIQNIDRYIKVDEQTNLIDSVVLASDISFLDDEIFVNLAVNPSGTNGFPEKYGLLKIDDEIITYTGKTFNSFTGCVRGFSGINSYKSESDPEELVFSETEISDHSSGSLIINLSSLFLKEFLLKTKYQLTPGFENRKISETINESILIKQIKDFYNSKGTDRSFELLFSILYEEKVGVIKPREYLFRPSDAQYQITRDFVVESIEGDPEELENSVLVQDEILSYTKAYAPVAKVEKIVSLEGKTYYKLSIDANYSRDLNVDGSIYGEFKIHPQTRVIGAYDSNSNTINVDSTVGFPNAGDLRITYQDGTEGIISYESKNINQFFDCSNITGIIDDTTPISLNVFAYGESFVNSDSIVRVRITSVLNNLDTLDDNYYLKSGYDAQLKTLGYDATDVKSNNWFFNISPIYNVESLEIVDESDQSYRINLFDPHIFRTGDKIKIINTNGEKTNSIVIDIVSDLSFIIGGQGELNINDNYQVQRDLLTPNSSKYSDITSVAANIQNAYKNKSGILIASSSLPYYPNQDISPSDKELVFSGTFDSDVFQITTDKDHGFYTGDILYYSPEKNITQIEEDNGNIIENVEILSRLFNEGVYFAKRIDSNRIQLALSYSDIFNSNFIEINEPVSVVNNKLQHIRFYNKKLKSQNLFREIKDPVNDGEVYPTLPGFTGILINGVEILNYKSRDTVYSGSLSKIDVISSGFGYDVINPPSLIISDSVGTGASAFCAVTGSLSEIRVVDPGFDYDDVPIIKITGGNGIGAKAYASMKLVDHQAFFNSDINSNRVSLPSNTIGFSTYHKFRNAEKIIYNTDNQRGVGGISTNSIYYVSVQSPTEVKLHITSSDAISGINTIDLTSYGLGKHSLRSYNKKSILGSINIENSGSGYENKKRTVSSTTQGVLTSINEIHIPNHGFNTGEIVKYSTTGTEIQGLTQNNEYYVTRIDENKFKISNIGTNGTESEFYFNTKQYANLQSVGSGTHIFNYPEINVEVIGNVGGVVKFNAEIDPIFRGEISSVHLESGGIGYGASEILNYNRQPLMRLRSGSGVQVTPIISDGKIVEVLINSSGSGYESSPDIDIIGDGIGAVLVPILENGRLVEIRVLESGIGYSANTTAINVVPSGSSSEFFARIQNWTVNLFQKNLSSINEEDGILETGVNGEYELQYSHLYAPRKLRELIYSKDQDGNVLYGRKDLRKTSNKEINSTDHSPIIGWAYDGNPIYGPYGYITKQGGIISQMKSGYKTQIKSNRPSLSIFPEGFFVEDYTHYNLPDETVLDEFNGKYCVTPEFPNGTYAYFMTIENSLADTDGKFSGYKGPVFPYVIGNKFRSRPNEFNFKRSSNQNDIDLNETDWVRNTHSYNILKTNAFYSYLETPNQLNQELTIKYASPGEIENIDILSGGSNYKVGDKLIFDNNGTKGYNVSAEVERVGGKSINSISVATTSIYNIELSSNITSSKIIAFSNSPHNLDNTDLVFLSGFNTTSSALEGLYFVGVVPNVLSLGSSVANTASTGIVTYFSVFGNLNYPNIRENDILRIGSEEVKVLNVDPKSSRIRILRSVNGTTGSSHSVSDSLYEIPRKLTINTTFRDSYTKKENRELYFNPIESIGLGTQFGVGIGTTISFSNPGVGITQIFIPTKSIYIPNHKLETGDEIVYYTNYGSPIKVSTNGISTSLTISNSTKLYVAKISDDLIGISTVKIGIGTQGTFVGITSSTQNAGTLFFTGIGTGVYHSFKTQYESLIGNINKNIVTVETEDNHNLANGDTVFIDINSGISTTIYIGYNDSNRKILVNPKEFQSVGVNTATNIITIPNHGFVRGQKVVHTATNPSIGLEDNGEYYVFFVDKDNIKLTNSYYDSLNSRPSVVGISSSSDGTLSLINPPIQIYRNSSVVFDLSDSSLSYGVQSTLYSAFDLEFYKDSNFTEPYESNGNGSIFEIEKIGRVGITSEAKVILTLTENTPDNLYYTLVPVYTGNIPENKEQITVDSEVRSNNEIQVKTSRYNGEHAITVGTTTSFTYNNSSIPEIDSYDPNSSTLNYETVSKNTTGEISKIKITNKGKNYYSLPLVSSVKSTNGTGASLNLSSKSIGKIKTTRIKNIGFNFPSDFTLRPSVSIPQVIQIDALSSFDTINTTFFGRGYSSAPKLVVLDGKTNDLITDVDLQFNIGSKKVEILKNTFSLNNVVPTIIPIQNSNGVGISSISYNFTTKEVTVVLSVGFSTENSFPFEIDDKILVENVSIGVGSEGRGFNSENYGYNLFTVTSTDPNIGGENGTVTYSLLGFIGDGETTGAFDPNNSSGRIIPEKYFPKFDIKIRKNNFIIGEKVFTNSSNGKVEDWEPNVNFIKILTRDNFSIGDTITGDTSKTKGVISSITEFDAFMILKSNSRFENGWISNIGFLNDDIQRIQDSFYYQNFSYSLKSRVDYDTWNDPVSTLNHTLGFRKFSDYQLESKNSNLSIVGLSTELTSFEVITDIVSVIDLNCVYDFDLVRENSLQIGNNTFSDEISFSNRILTDYSESIGNRVLSIDDISDQFNSNPRPSPFVEVDRFNLSDVRTQKYFAYIRDTRFLNDRQFLIITTLIDDFGRGFINQYGRVETRYDMGSFDLSIDGTQGVLLYYPTKFKVNDFYVATFSYNLNDNLLGAEDENFGGVVDIRSNSTLVSSASTTIVSIADTNRSTKVLVSISGADDLFEFNELTVIHDGVTVDILEYGQFSSISPEVTSTIGFGTYYPYISNSQLKIDFIPNVSEELTINTIQVSFASTDAIGIGTYDMKHARIEGRSVSIASSISPVENVVCEYPFDYDAAYFIVQVSDDANNQHQVSEVVVVNDENSAYITEFGVLGVISGLGTIGANKVSAGTNLVFTPNPNIDVNVKVFMNTLKIQDDAKDIFDFMSSEIQTGYALYFGTERDIKKSFELTHKTQPIFERYFDAENPNVVDIENDTVHIPDHFYVTGELLHYSNSGIGYTQSIGIGTTTFVGVGSTDLLPEDVYVIKVGPGEIKLASSVENALKLDPISLNLTNVGVGSYHKFTSTNQNAKALVALDNVIQSPVVSTAITTTLFKNVFTTEDVIYFSDVSSFVGGDLIKIEDEIMKIETIGVGATNSVSVRRAWLGTTIVGYSTGSLVTKIKGNYNIVGNVINFVEAPYGKIPLSTTSNPPNERDWDGFSTKSSFQGRTFLRSGIINSSNEPYHKNYIFDDISSDFNGFNKQFIITNNTNNISGISNENAIVLINDIFQGPGLTYDYNLLENVGITSISFTGAATSVAYDVNNASIPRGGVIVSVGSTTGFGYQPLISAGGTATVSIAGTISSISIGNSGSGYRPGSQVVRVGVATSSSDSISIEFIGTADISNGNIVSVAITNPGVGYTISNPPYVIFDSPLSYTNIPLIYSSSSGVGTEAKVNIIVRQDSSVIDFEIINNGYGYENKDELTIPVGGATGIPTTGSSQFNEFRISVESVFSDKFSGWSIGELQVLDNLDSKFNGRTKAFPITVSNNPISIRASKGSNINIQDTLLIFINDVLQVPGKGYVFNGGSIIRFTEPPKSGDKSKIIFYRGSGSVDVVDVNILETVKPGDELIIDYDPSVGQSSDLQEETRYVTSINSTDLVSTNPYFGPGNTSDEILERPVRWCRQSEDRIIDEQKVGKDRMLYEPIINPTAYLIKSVGIGSTIVYVDNIRPFFNPINENNISVSFQKSVALISQEIKEGCSATALVSIGGTISSVQVTNGGRGYMTPPTVVIQDSVGIGTTLANNASASASITSGIVTSIIINNSGSGYDPLNPPIVIIEEPTFNIEYNTVTKYEGDSGLIVGIFTGSVGIASTAIIFDLHIPINSFLRNTSITGLTTVSGIQTGDYFVVHNSNIGNPTTSLDSNNSIIAIGASFVDNVYKVSSVSIAQTSVLGVGTTAVVRVTTSVISNAGLSSSNTNKIFGEYSWGKVSLDFRSKQNQYEAYTLNGVTGLSTGTILRRTKSLRFSNYIP